MKSQQIQNRIAQLEDNIAELKKELAKAKEIKPAHLQVYGGKSDIRIALLEDFDNSGEFLGVWVDGTPDHGLFSTGAYKRQSAAKMAKTLEDEGLELIGTLELTIKPL